MADDTEWVTVKIPKSVRDPCREYLDGTNEGRPPDQKVTYGDLMATGLRVKEAGTDEEIARALLLEKMQEIRDGMDSGDLTPLEEV